MALIAQINESEVTDVTGEVPAGCLFASFKNTGSVDLTVNGFTIEPGDTKTYPFLGKAYPTIGYVVSDQTTLAIMYIS
ncbi:MAG: hypothetical protein WBA74_03645 [Cyclobacteriaceae bacterium]